MTTTWVIQNNLRQEGDGIPEMLDALGSQGIPHELVDVIPFSDDPLEIKSEGKIVLFGSVNMRTAAMRGPEARGLFFDPDSFSYLALKEGYGSLLLNADSEIMSVGDFLHESGSRTNYELFIRPADDSKTLLGSVKTRSEWVSELTRDLELSNGPVLDTRIQISAPKRILREWRTIIVNGTPVAGCQSRVNLKKEWVRDLPKPVVAFSVLASGMYSPSPVFVLDVCELPGNRYRVVETNCFNCAGMYVCNVPDIVRAVTAYKEKNT